MAKAIKPVRLTEEDHSDLISIKVEIQPHLLKFQSREITASQMVRIMMDYLKADESRFINFLQYIQNYSQDGK